MLHRKIEICQGLGLNALGGIDQKQGTLTGADGTADLIGEVHMSRSVNEIELILLSVGSGIGNCDCLTLDGDAPLLLDVHVIEKLGTHGTAGSDEPCLFDETVSKGALAMVDVSDDAEIAFMFYIHQDVVYSLNQEFRSPEGPCFIQVRCCLRGAQSREAP